MVREDLLVLLGVEYRGILSRRKKWPVMSRSPVISDLRNSPRSLFAICKDRQPWTAVAVTLASKGFLQSQNILTSGNQQTAPFGVFLVSRVRHPPQLRASASRLTRGGTLLLCRYLIPDNSTRDYAALLVD